MKNTLAKVISTLMIATALLGFAAVLPIHAYVDNPTVFVDPQNNIFPPPSMTVGSTFSVNVSIANCSNIAGVQFKLHWDPNLLTRVGSASPVLLQDPLITPTAYQDNINTVKNTFNDTEGSYTYGATYYDIADGISKGYLPFNVTPTTFPGTNGKHAIVIIVLKVAPTGLPPILGYVDCNLTLTDVVIGDPASNQIATTDINGYYRLNWVAPPTPYFSVQYPSYAALNVGDVFNVSVLVNDMDPGWQAVGFEFKLGYNNSLLNVQHVYEGSWLPPFGAPPNQGTSFAKFVSLSGYVQAGDVVMPDANGTWHSPFPSGTGILATIQFNATLQAPFPTVLSCPLPLFDCLVADWHANVLNQSQAPIGSYYSIQGLISGRRIDIYTGWPSPYGGQGPNQPSDMFWPQKAVSLYANVTYNNWPEQQKDVAFQVIAPNNQTWAIIYARTDANGIAYTTFRLPWPCNNPEQWFGVWTIIGTVDIACTIMNDTLQFHYDYLVRIFKQTTDYTDYNHTNYVLVNITYGTHLQQTNAVYVDELTGSTVDLSNITIVVTAFDNVRVPYGFIDQQAAFQDPISANATTQAFGGTVWCQYKNFTVTLSVYIPKWAVAGPSEIDCAALNNWPYVGGTVISGYYDTVSGTWSPYDPTFININAV